MVIFGKKFKQKFRKFKADIRKEKINKPEKENIIDKNKNKKIIKKNKDYICEILNFNKIKLKKIL